MSHRCDRDRSVLTCRVILENPNHTLIIPRDDRHLAATEKEIDIGDTGMLRMLAQYHELKRVLLCHNARAAVERCGADH